MASKLNHHFVPKYLFKLFNGGEKYIHLVTKSSSNVIIEASIRHQCSRHKFYGSEEVEDILAAFDARHVEAYRAVIRECWSDDRKGLSDEEYYILLEALLLQRARTPRAAEGLAQNSENLALCYMRQYLRASPSIGMRDQIVRAIDAGEVVLKQPILRPLLNSLDIGLRSMIGISDLQMVLLRNFTHSPFVFGDSPCVYYNRYLYDLLNVGVLGIQSRGLMIFMPLNNSTQILLYDPRPYRVQGESIFVDVIKTADIAQLNALQIHSAKTAIYFGRRENAGSVVELIAAHRASFQETNNQFRRWAPGTILLDGRPNEYEVIQMFEGQLSFRLDLSFVKTMAVPPDENPRKARSSELHRKLTDNLEPFVNPPQ